MESKRKRKIDETNDEKEGVSMKLSKSASKAIDEKLGKFRQVM